MTKVFVGVDVGLQGAVAMIRGESVTAVVTPVVTFQKQKKTSHFYDIGAMVKTIQGLLRDTKPNDVRVCIEMQVPRFGSKVVVCPKCHLPVTCPRCHSLVKIAREGASSIGTLMRGLGIWESLFVALGYNIPDYIYPREWQKILQGLPGATTKECAIEFCKRRYPDVDLRASDRARIPHTGKADAICLATFCKFLDQQD